MNPMRDLLEQDEDVAKLKAMDINELLRSTRPIFYDTGDEDWPYAYSGTCFPVRFRKTLYVVSADHCFKNFGIEPKQTMYLTPGDPRMAFGFDLQIRAESPSAKDPKHKDQVILRVASSTHNQRDIDKVVAVDLSDRRNSRLPTSSNLKDIVLRGYPWDCPAHGIDYTEEVIRHQAYTTNGCFSTEPSGFAYCYYVSLMSPVPDGMKPNGMSGSPIYGITHAGQAVFCGMVIEYNSRTRDYLAVGPEVLVNTLLKLSAGQANQRMHR